jgi:hypothetical protein
MIEMPDLKFNDLSNAKLMKEACDETQKILSSIFNQKIEVVIWNTQIKFLGPNDLHGIIKGLQKIQKRTT